MLNPKIVKEDNKYVYMEWTPDLSGQGYRFYVDGVAVSRDFKPSLSSTRFRKTDSVAHQYGVAKMDVVLPLETVTYPPVVPNPDAPPWSGWNHEVSLTNPSLPNRYFKYTNDTVTLNCFGDMPVMGAGTTFPRHLVSSYLQNGQALALEGKEVSYKTEITFPSDFLATTGEQNWLIEWHTANNQLSNAIGLRCDFPVSFTAPGKNPTWYFRPIGPNGAPPVNECIGPPVTFGKTYQIEVIIKWSSTNGRFSVLLDNVQVFDKNIAALWPNDQPGFGFYNYRLAVPWDSSVTFKKLPSTI